MRMWNVNPILLCNKHLLGEHVEMHMFSGCIVRGKNIDGYVRRGLVEIHNICKRHNDISEEMISRGMNHNSPLPEFKYTISGFVDVDRNLEELMNRCELCSRWIKEVTT